MSNAIAPSMTGMVARSSYEAAGRYRKATRTAQVLLDQGATAVQAAGLPQSHRQIVAELAGCRSLSDASWDFVVGILLEHERQAVA